MLNPDPIHIDYGLLAQVRALPKIDLHRHLEGAVRLPTLVEIARRHGIEMPEYDVETLRPFVQMMPGETRNHQHFLGKFHTLRQFFRSPDVIRRVTHEAVADAAADNVKYLELRFTPPALSNIMGCSYHDVIGWVCDAASDAAGDYAIQVRLIISMNRHESVEIGEQVLAAALAHRDRGVVAVDLAGNEDGYSARPFRKLFKRAKAEGLGVTIHAGEWAGAESVRYAVKYLNPDRIGHGVRAIEDPTLVDLLAKRRTVLEVCPSSNVDSGVVADWPQHPLRELRRRVPVTINTDDPLVSGITLSDEIARAMTFLGLSLDDVKQHILTAAQVSFLPQDEREALVTQFAGWLGVAV